jgi:hypothetical protein
MTVATQSAPGTVDESVKRKVRQWILPYAGDERLRVVGLDAHAVMQVSVGARNPNDAQWATAARMMGLIR